MTAAEGFELTRLTAELNGFGKDDVRRLGALQIAGQGDGVFLVGDGHLVTSERNLKGKGGILHLRGGDHGLALLYRYPHFCVRDVKQSVFLADQRFFVAEDAVGGVVLSFPLAEYRFQLQLAFDNVTVKIPCGVGAGDHPLFKNVNDGVGGFFRGILGAWELASDFIGIGHVPDGNADFGCSGVRGFRFVVGCCDTAAGSRVIRLGNVFGTSDRQNDHKYRKDHRQNGFCLSFH